MAVHLSRTFGDCSLSHFINGTEPSSSWYIMIFVLGIHTAYIKYRIFAIEVQVKSQNFKKLLLSPAQLPGHSGILCYRRWSRFSLPNSLILWQFCRICFGASDHTNKPGGTANFIRLLMSIAHIPSCYLSSAGSGRESKTHSKIFLAVSTASIASLLLTSPCGTGYRESIA